MPRYALIQRYSGYIFGVETAPDPATAAIQCQIDFAGDKDWIATDMSLSYTENDGYDVHPVPDGWDCCNDGQDEADIAAATLLPVEAVILVEEAAGERSIYSPID